VHGGTVSAGAGTVLPETLVALAQQYLASMPRDAVDSHPLRRTAVDQFLLYSVGRSQPDGGGKPVWRGSGTHDPNIDRGD